MSVSLASYPTLIKTSSNIFYVHRFQRLCANSFLLGSFSPMFSRCENLAASINHLKECDHVSGAKQQPRLFCHKWLEPSRSLKNGCCHRGKFLGTGRVRLQAFSQLSHISRVLREFNLSLFRGNSSIRNSPAEPPQLQLLQRITSKL